MNLRRVFGRQSAAYISNLHGRVRSSHFSYQSSPTNITTVPLYHQAGVYHTSSFLTDCKDSNFPKNLGRYIHSLGQANTDNSSSGLEDESEVDDTMNDFLSRFVWIMRKKLNEVYPDSNKRTIDAMLVVIVEKVVSEMEKGDHEQMMGGDASIHSQDFSEDLWRTVWEVSNDVLKDMDKEKKKEKMKTFLHSEEVKEMSRFAGEAGIHGDMLRELRFKWAREKMEESEFYESLERLKKEDDLAEYEGNKLSKNKNAAVESVEGTNEITEGKTKIASLPKRQGKMKYKIYGLDLSHPRWGEVANKIHENDEVMFPQVPKSISGKCKVVTDKILSLREEDDPSPLLREWITLLEPNRIDWIAFLDRLKNKDSNLYFKIAEYVLAETSFQANIRDYSKLIDDLAKENRLEAAERILRKMNENGIHPDVITSTILVHMYCKSGNLIRAKETFTNLRGQGFQPDMKLYKSMIMAYVNAGEPAHGETLLREMENRDLKPAEEIYLALLHSFARKGDVKNANNISSSMHYAGFKQSLESCALMIEAYGRAGDPESARSSFDDITTLGHKPDDRCISGMVSAYAKKNYLDKALNLLLELEKDGLQPGVATHTALFDWLTKMELFDEAEQILDKIAEQGEAPPFKIHIALCDMYSKVGNEKKALQALGVVESKIDHLEPEDFERIIGSLEAAGFVQDSQRMQGYMKARGISLSNPFNMRRMSMGALANKHFTERPEQRGSLQANRSSSYYGMAK